MVMQANSPVVPITEQCPPIMPKGVVVLLLVSLILNQPGKCSLDKVSYTLSRTATLTQFRVPKSLCFAKSTIATGKPHFHGNQPMIHLLIPSL